MEGFGFYTWADGREFQGWWHRNKMHGVGIHISADEVSKFGLWQCGKRIKWLSETEIAQVQKGSNVYI